MIKTTNKNVAVEVLKSNQPEKNQPISGGLLMSDRLTTKLISSKVVFNSENYHAGDTLYFRSDILKMPYVMNKLQLGEVVFVVVPESDVVAYEKIDLSARGD